ncbi:hypothetical protein BYT27DRAFT_7183979 [Phlegmacium glaucopus]|nr:hypothetical protein BYT27DRAFT_7183979 [Phlegmacium glaucopus]
MLRILGRAVNYQIRPLFSLNSTGLRGFTTRRRTAKEIILLFRKIVGFLKNDPETENILGYVNRELDKMLPNVRSPPYVYERVITFLVGRQYAQEAVLLYQRMHQAGLMSSNVLDAKMLAIALASSQDSPQPLILRLAPIFTDPGYTEKDFSGLLKTMSKYRVDKDIVCTLVESFLAARRPSHIVRPEFLAPLLSARTRSGDVDVALEVLDQFSGANQLNRAARASVHAPYVQVLAALQETRTWDTASVNRVLDLMTTQGLAPNLVTINILLSREVRLGNYRAAIAMYSMLKEMRITRKISPDSFTFGSMFLLYRMIRPRAVRKHHRNDIGSPFPPRALYHDFMLAVKPKGHAKRIVPSTTLMNVILRAFIRQRDYAGAFVVLNSYSLFNIPLDHRTYYRVIKHVVRRIWLEVSKQYRGEVGWSIKFLGVQDYRNVELNEDLVQNLLAFVSQETFHLISPLYASRHHMPSSNADVKYKLPSMEMMESVFLPGLQDFHYDPVPLRRILRRAILANLRLADDNAGPAEVSKAIADAKADMLPKIPQRPQRSSGSMGDRPRHTDT